MSTTIMYYKCTKEIDNQTFYGIKFLTTYLQILFHHFQKRDKFELCNLEN